MKLIAQYPFPHLVDERNDLPITEAVAEVRSLVNRVGWDHYFGQFEHKLALPFERWPDDVQALATIRDWMQSTQWIAHLEEVFGVYGLIWDGLGGGIHRIVRGGRLGMHVDFNRSNAGLYRRVNCLLYLAGEPDRGGDLELWQSSEGLGSGRVVPLEAGTLVCFATSESSWHGHPRPYDSDIDRLSIASYYFTVEAPEGVANPHTTVFTDG